ncbi:hypothetical protein GJ496_011948 [Pomphorhynchus laevis]|nr:hypothetical protein GJ496_011948 [Pomphorhynchus laevis]
MKVKVGSEDGVANCSADDGTVHLSIDTVADAAVCEEFKQIDTTNDDNITTNTCCNSDEIETQNEEKSTSS